MSAIPLRRIEGKYEILEKLGEGGMGAVYKVRHRLLDDIRVIKMMRPQLVADEEFKARFQREAKLAIKLRHPNIAHLIDFTIDEEDGTAFIVMEFIDGMTLEEMLRNAGPPPLGLALEIAQQSLRALTCLHEKGFVHRDISPDNLMLTEDADGQPLMKLIDLGIAKVLGGGLETSNLTGTGIFLGKLRYSPPEQFGTEGASQVGARGDLYSFGIVLYELLTGKYPIQGRDASSVMGGHLFRPPLGFDESDPEGHVPPALRALVLRALAKDPAERFASARELGGALAALRAPGDIAPGDLQRALTRLPSGTLRVPPAPPGSTQDRLDLQFGLQTTPSRGRALEKTQTPGASRRAVEDAVALIERHVQRGDLLTAGTELQWAIDTFGEQPRLGELRTRLQQRRSQELELRVQTLLKEAESLFAQQDFEGALERLQRGKSLAPNNARILASLEKTEAAVQEQRHKRDVAGVQKEIEDALARADYRAAERQLYEAEAIYGEQEAFSALHRRLVELRQRGLEAQRRAERLAAAVKEIEGPLGRGDLDEAERLLGQAVATFGEEKALEDLRTRLEKRRRALRQAESATLVQSAVRRRDESDLDGALAEARRALEIDPENGIARVLAEGLAAELVRRAEDASRAARDAEAAALLGTARSRREADDLVGAAEAAQRALALDAQNAAARGLLEEIQAEKRRREEEARRAAELARAVAAIEARLEEKELAKAEALLNAAVSSYGDVEALVNLRSRLEDLRRAAREAKAEKRRREEEARRAEQLAAAVTAIESRLAAGDFAQAEALLVQAVASHGEVEVLVGLRGRLEELRRTAREAEVAAEVAALLEKARKRRAEDDLEGTLTIARRIFTLEAENTEAQAVIEEIEAERRRRQEETRRAEQLAAALASIDACLDREDPDGAAKLLPGIVTVFGDLPALRERFERAEGLRRRKLEERVASLTEQARKLISRGELDAALGALREAGRAQPDHPDVRALVKEAETELRRKEEESRREQELAAALSSIDVCLEKGDLAGAARLLPGAVASFGGAPALRERWERLDLLQRHARVETLRGEAAALIQAGHSDRAARKLRQALELDPGNREVAELLAGLSR